MGYATILGLDLGKFKSVCCAMDAVSLVPDSRCDLVSSEAAAGNTLRQRLLF